MKALHGLVSAGLIATAPFARVADDTVKTKSP